MSATAPHTPPPIPGGMYCAECIRACPELDWPKIREAACLVNGTSLCGPHTAEAPSASLPYPTGGGA